MPVDHVATVYWYLADSQWEQPVLQTLSLSLKEHGYHQKTENAIHALCTAATEHARRQQTAVFLLVGEPAELIVTTVRLRSISSEFLIIPVLPSFNEAALVQLMMCGADAYFSLKNSSALLMAQLHSLLRRSRHKNLVANNDLNHWVLMDEGWNIRTPKGVIVALTTLERALFQAFASQEGHRVPHDILLLAISASEECAQAIKINRLGVIISRLRRKFEQIEIELPLKSVHNWGYMFAAPIVVHE